MTLSSKTFDDIKHVGSWGQEVWYARELMIVLGYSKWQNFEKAINRAKIACANSGFDVNENFYETVQSKSIGSGANRTVKDCHMSRFACYLTALNGDPRKEIIALAQTYFAVKARQQELQDLIKRLSEDEKRLFYRGTLKQRHMLLAEQAKKAGVNTPLEYAEFMNSGYRGLYGGETAKDIAVRKGLKQGQDISDYMNSFELATNIFRSAQTERVMKEQKTSTKGEANKIHYEVGKMIRKGQEQVGTVLEKEPTPEKSILELEKESMAALKANNTKELPDSNKKSKK